MTTTAQRISTLNAASSNCPHGTRAKYVSGCKCLMCKAAASRYAVQRKFARLKGDTRELVDAGQIRDQICQLHQGGMSNRAIAAAAGVSLSIVIGIRSGVKLRVRRHIAKAILAAITGSKGEQI
jgi:hypothetical protein